MSDAATTPPTDRARGTVAPHEWLVALLWSAMIVAIVSFPVWHGYHEAPTGWTFLGLPGQFRQDCNAYLSWIRQAYEGRLTFRNLYTAEPHRAVFFQPLHLLMGVSAALTGASLISVWHIVQFTACLLVGLSIYWFSAQFTDRIATRLLALVLATTASGLGWLTPLRPDIAKPLQSIDLWMGESNAFHAMSTSVYPMTNALWLLLVGLTCVLRYRDTGRRSYPVAAGLLALFMTSIHQYDIITFFAVVAIWAMVAWLVYRDVAGARRLIMALLVVAVFTVPYCIYSLAVIKFDPVFSHIKWDMPVPPARALLQGFGLPLALALPAALVPTVRRNNRDVFLLLAWLLCVPVLLALPVGFSSKLIWGVHPVICLLAAMLIVATLDGLRKRIPLPALRPALVTVIAFVIVSFCAIGSGFVFDGLIQHNRQHELGDYLPNSTLEAMQWLDDHSNLGDVVIASPAFSYLVPGYTGDTVYEGHWANTIDLMPKRLWVIRLFSVGNDPLPLESVRQTFVKNRVRYLMLDLFSARALKVPQAHPQFVFLPLVNQVFRNDTIVIWEVQPNVGDAETRPTGHSATQTATAP